MTYFNYFRELTGYPPYGFQEALGLRLLNGESLVFRAPTGSGKTWTTVAPFLYALKTGSRLADRLIYALPLRSLASSLHATVFEAIQRSGPVAKTAKDRDYPSGTTYCSLQMGGEKNDPFFEGDLIFCTIDQVLSGYLMMPVSLPDRLANIVAGALPGSLLILDEAHLLESGIALGTVIEMLDRFRGAIQFVLMTATMSDESMNWLAKKLSAKVPDLPEDEIRKLPVQRTKKRVWRWRGEQLGSSAVAEAHKAGRTLVVVNQTGRAQDLFEDLKEKYRGSSTRLACLHSRFFPEDRQQVEGELQPWFGKEATESDVILVTTQVVEAGMDISADHILTELAPMNALVQRAGRTARYEARPIGLVTVFEVDNVLPYNDAEQEITRSRTCLSRLHTSGEDVDFLREQKWIEEVHSEAERKDLAAYENLHRRRQRVEEAIQTGNRGLLSDLVRDIDQVNVLLSGDPDSVQFRSAVWPRLLSVPRLSVWKLKDAIERGAQQIWRAESADEDYGPPRFRWLRVKSTAELKGCWLIALGPDSAKYSEGSGFRIAKVGEEVPVRYAEMAPILRYQYFYESWLDHVARVMDQAMAMAPANSIGAGKLEKNLALSIGTVENLLELCAQFHDIGKLSEKWQADAWKYETTKTGMLRKEAIAHTTKEAGESGPKLPHHAVEGAFACVPVLVRDFPKAAWAIASSIARHHSARACEASLFKLIPEAEDLAGRLGGGEVFLRSGASRLDCADFSAGLSVGWEENNRPWWPVYSYLVRRLRLADQAGTRAGVFEGSRRA